MNWRVHAGFWLSNTVSLWPTFSHAPVRPFTYISTNASVLDPTSCTRAPCRTRTRQHECCVARMRATFACVLPPSELHTMLGRPLAERNSSTREEDTGAASAMRTLLARSERRAWVVRENGGSARGSRRIWRRPCEAGEHTLSRVCSTLLYFGFRFTQALGSLVRAV